MYFPISFLDNSKNSLVQRLDLTSDQYDVEVFVIIFNI